MFLLLMKEIIENVLDIEGLGMFNCVDGVRAQCH